MQTDFLVVGSGIAGLSLALKLASQGNVLVVTKKQRSDTATRLAQGGIACVLGSDDHFVFHEYDTILAGDGLSHEDAVRAIVRDGPARIKELEKLGVNFTKDHTGQYELGKEGGHSKRRIVHSGDFTGLEIQRVLVEKAASNPNIEILEDFVVVDLLTSCKIASGKDKTERFTEEDRCLGAYVLDASSGKIHAILADITFLATGGAGKVYLYTSNPDVATGDGIAIAYRAGVRVANLEFVQFHPTLLYHSKAKNFLISEALRGEGAKLIDWQGHAFMEKYDPVRKELAGRDVVARAIDAELKRTGKECVYLDISHRPADFVKKRFPNIYRTCLNFGIDITREPIPVVPAAHYMCGGVVTDTRGQTDLPGLFAVGETACTGFHGANRLASNSLLEGMVMAHRAAGRALRLLPRFKSLSRVDVPPWDSGGAVDMEEAVLISHNWDVIRRLMWNYVGIVRSTKRLKLAAQRLKPILKEINQHYWDYIITRDFLELRNLAMTAQLIIEAASSRKESRGGHYVVDYPLKDDWNWRRDTLLRRS